MKILSLFFIILLFLIINKKITNSSFNFIRHLNFLSGIEYFLYMIFSIGCLILSIQKEYNIPILYEYDFIVRILFIYTACKLFSLKNIFLCIKNPNNQYRLQVLENLSKEEQILANIEKEKENIQIIKEKQKKVLKEFNIELKELEKNSKFDTEEELAKKIDSLTTKYNKLLEDCKKN